MAYARIRTLVTGAVIVVIGVTAAASRPARAALDDGRPAVAVQAAQAAVHPKVDAAQECEACHEKQTPRVHKLWAASKHGTNLVKCFMCHGALDAPDFTRKPAPDRCEPCHDEQVASLQAPSMKGKTCFNCHDTHALSPHKAVVEGGQR